MKRTFRVWVPPFVVSSTIDRGVHGERLPVFLTRTEGRRHFPDVIRATLTLSPKRKKKAKART